MRLVKSCVLRRSLMQKELPSSKSSKKTQMVTMQVLSSLPTKIQTQFKNLVEKLDSEANFELLNTFKVLGE